MARIRRLFSRIASIATIMIAAIPMSAISSSSSREDPIAAATRFHTKVFFIYVALLVLAAIFQWWVWSTNNRLQDAIREDSDARIVEAKAEGAKANERAEKLESANLTLKGQVAGLETTAADAKAAQQRVETDLEKQKEVTARAEKDVAGLKRAAAEQQERAAKAERELLEIKERLKHRTISVAQQEQLIKLLTPIVKPKEGRLVVVNVVGDSEGHEFATQINKILKASGFTTEGPNSGFFTVNPVGFGIIVHSLKTAPAYASAILRAFDFIGIPMGIGESEGMPEGNVEIVIGLKPDKP
jgi:hypothetical protein